MITRRCGKRVALGALLALTAPACIQPAAATWATDGWTQHVIMGPNARSIQAGAASYLRSGHGTAPARYGRVSGPLQCVPFARANSGIELTGNAANWWEHAVGFYERGARPEVGAVLNFRANGRMRLGHVAVVSRVLDSRNVKIDHANWAYPGGVSRAITVVDVSPQNNWTAVRVELSQRNEFGAVYPTYGFIYDRPDHGTLVANTDVLPAPTLNPPSSDLRPASERTLVSLSRDTDEEVAEAGDDVQPRTRHAAHSRTKFGKPLHGAALRRVAARSQPGARVTHNHRGGSNT